MTVDRYELALLIAGAAALAVAWLPSYTARRPVSLPMVVVALGIVAFMLPLGLPGPDPRTELELTERLTEGVVIVSLMGAGLKIDRPFGWRSWSTTWRMLAVAMPVTIALTAVAGALIGGLPAVSALLLGSILAPTDPVLASDVQVGEPDLDEEPSADAEESVRFTLTSEGGLNDALAFPFVYAAIRIAEEGWNPSGWLLEWFGWDLVARIAIGLVVGWLVGRVVGVIAFRPPGPMRALSETPQGFVAVAATLLAYGATELLAGYGFLAVFVAAVVIRGSERQHEFQRDLHAFSEQTEKLLVVGLLLLFGGALVSGVLEPLTWGGGAVAILLVLAVRPLAGHLSLLRTPLSSTERSAISFFGIRGFGSVYYLAYALNASDHFGNADLLWAITAIAMALSITIHGVTATAAMRLVDRGARPWARFRRRA